MTEKKYHREVIYLDDETEKALRKYCKDMREKKGTFIKRILIRELRQEGYL